MAPGFSISSTIVTANFTNNWEKPCKKTQLNSTGNDNVSKFLSTPANTSTVAPQHFESKIGQLQKSPLPRTYRIVPRIACIIQTNTILTASKQPFLQEMEEYRIRGYCTAKMAKVQFRIFRVYSTVLHHIYKIWQPITMSSKAAQGDDAIMAMKTKVVHRRYCNNVYINGKVLQVICPIFLQFNYEVFLFYGMSHIHKLYLLK